MSQAQSQTLIKTQFNSIFVPAGFDSNDRVQLVGEGVFSNSCYKSGATEVKVDRANKTIELVATAYKYDGFCLQVLVPYNEVVDLGVLEAGDYKIISGINQSEIGRLPVMAAKTSSPDDFIYAPVSQAYFEQLPEGESADAKVVLTGEYTNSCLGISDVKVTLEPKVVVLQPITVMNQKLENPNCKNGKFPFKHEVLVKGLKPSSYLLHVRALNATAVNQVVEVY